MKKIIFALATVSLLASCVVGTNGNLSGAFLTNSTTGPVSVSSAKIGAKSGESCIVNILGLVASGDASIQKAAKNGGIKEIATVDTQVTTFVGVYGKSCTIVTGN